MRNAVKIKKYLTQCTKKLTSSFHSHVHFQLFLFNHFHLQGSTSYQFPSDYFQCYDWFLIRELLCVLYFIIWAMAVTFKFYMVACAEQYKIQQAHAELRRQESVSAAGADQRGWLTRVKGAFSNEYSAERVNERRLARAEVGVAQANKV